MENKYACDSRCALADQHEAMLATIVQVEGSAYRKAGALNGCGNIKIGTESIVLTAFCQRVERPLLMN